MTIYYVDGAVGDDANAGTSEGAGNAWATVDKAMNTVIAGDTVYIKASATYSELVTLDTIGALATPISLIGYSSTITDNGKATISGTTNCIVTATNFGGHYIFKNLVFSGASGDGFKSIGGDFFKFVNCEFNSNGGKGCDLDNDCTFVNCIAHSNGGIGFDVDQDGHFAGCIAYGNGGDQFVVADGTLYKCVAYGGTGSSNVAFLSNCEAVIGCTFDGEGAATYGFYTSTGQALHIDNIIYDCVNGYYNTVYFGALHGVYYNLLNSNTTDYNIAGDIGEFDVTAAPAFADEANDDYRPSSSSPAVDAQLKPGGIT